MLWRYLALAIGGFAISIIGLSLAYRYDLEWLRILAVTVPVFVGGTGAMLIKRRHQRRNRTGEPDSIEHVHDVRARAGAYVFALVATTVALAVGVVAPGVASWVILLGLLAALVAGYVFSRLWINRDARQ